MERQDPFAKFEGVISRLEEIREHIGEPVPPVLAKVMDHIDPVSRAIIEKSPFIVMASATSDGYPDVSPKGDPVGFVKVLDEQYLAIPDRPGNKRVDTFRNLLQNPYLAILFMIPGKGETLRITGQARIVRDLPLRESMAIAGRVPEFAIVMHVERVLIHCPKCVVRAKLWQPEQWPDSSNTAGFAQAMIAHAKLDTTPEELEALAEREGLTRLY
ncbi:MAG: pyridoxamine 5'-phosphate oxidase family protein [Desulfobacterales bacterium]|nr:pyridoxamine 5'-phosphate oxidase family protein [Desulfobacterales bacterium]